MRFETGDFEPRKLRDSVAMEGGGSSITELPEAIIHEIFSLVTLEEGG